MCQHEIEYIHQAYNQREGGFSPTAFWDHPVVTGVQTTPFKIDIDQGEAILFTVDKLMFLRGNKQPVDVGATTYSLSTEPEDLLEIGDSLIGRNLGSGKLVVDVLTVPSEFIQSTELGVNHQLISLVVNDTTPPPPPCNPALLLREDDGGGTNATAGCGGGGGGGGEEP